MGVGSSLHTFSTPPGPVVVGRGSPQLLLFEELLLLLVRRDMLAEWRRMMVEVEKVRQS